MRKIFYFLLMTNFAYSQITIRNENVIEKPYFKPKTFDSISNIKMQKKFVDYKQYIGYKLFYKPLSIKFKNSKPEKYLINYLTTDKITTIIKSGKIPFDDVIIYRSFNHGKGLSGQAKEQYQKLLKKYENIDKIETDIYSPEFIHSKTDKTDGEIYGDITTIKENVESKYFTILGIEGKEQYSKDNSFKKLEDLSDDELDWRVALRFKLKNDYTQDTLYWNINQARFIKDFPFLLVPYFEKEKKEFVGKNLVAKKVILDLIDIKTGEVININKDDKWFCEDLSLTETKNSKYFEPLYYLSNQKNNIIVHIDELRKLFITESEYNKIQEEIKRQNEEKIQLQKEQELKEIEESKKYKQYCINKYGSKIGSLIYENKVIIGMNKDMCLESWGEPLDINRTIIKGLVYEQWVYGFGTYLYFNNGILTAIQD